jgi:hypothetical protein
MPRRIFLSVEQNNLAVSPCTNTTSAVAIPVRKPTSDEHANPHKTENASVSQTHQGAVLCRIRNRAVVRCKRQQEEKSVQHIRTLP